MAAEVRWRRDCPVTNVNHADRRAILQGLKSNQGCIVLWNRLPAEQ